ncbi:hypothetical protein FRC07_005176 [Ceratobasidium sp. 392]|nr:hypothetical protein FRC07_005176 [Ceratobasidium sp. 392]
MIVDTTNHMAITIATLESDQPSSPPTQGWLSWLMSSWRLGAIWIAAHFSIHLRLFSRSEPPISDLESGLSYVVHQQDNSEVTVAAPSTLSSPIAIPSAPRPSRFIENLAEHPHFASTASVKPVRESAPAKPPGAPFSSRFVEHLPEHPRYDKISPIRSTHKSTVATDSEGHELLVLQEGEDKPLTRPGASALRSPAGNDCRFGKACAHSGVPHQHLPSNKPPPVAQDTSTTASDPSITNVEASRSPSPSVDSHAVCSRLPSGEQARLRMHEQAAARIKKPALRSFQTRSSGTARIVPSHSSSSFNSHRTNSGENSSTESYMRPKRSSAHYENFKQGGAGLKEWMERFGSKYGQAKMSDSVTLNMCRSDKDLSRSPSSTPESSGPTTPTAEFMGATGTSEDEGQKCNPGDTCSMYDGQYVVGGNDAVAL